MIQMTNIVSDKHISAIVAFAHGTLWDSADMLEKSGELAQVLKDSAIEAHNEANMDEPGLLLEGWQMVQVDVPSPVEVLKLIETYESQVCDSQGFHYHQAAYEIRSIRSMAIAQLDGYSAAPFSL
uniref:Uncharacterized protein n=2 Tax=Pseudomonas syringae pv. actinidiae TaxID=103796 RepID=A0A2P0QEW6_PSESF|nr:hypothetical protein [Pseudomonas syringae pv. actinidiae]ARO45012.1 hypothetical protein [Pseudomonas syringae pv. actinidiae]